MSCPSKSHSSDNWSTSLSLLEQAQRYDPHAWNRLVKLYSPLINHWCRGANLQPADAENVRQEVFGAVFRNLADFRHDRMGDTFRGWLRVITHRKIMDHYRGRPHEYIGIGREHEPITNKSESVSDAVKNSRQREAQILCRRILQLLHQHFQERTWRAFWRTIVDGQRPSEVAEELGMSLNAVYLARSHVLKRLHDEFGDLLDFA